MDSRVDSLASLAAILDFWQGIGAASDRRGKRRLIWQALMGNQGVDFTKS